MHIPNTIKRINVKIDRWFMSPEPNAAGRLGIFRILFSLFYLWELSTQFSENFSGIPKNYWHHNLYVLRYFFNGLGESLPIIFFSILESCLVAGLVFLLFGYKTRIATIFVLIVGCIIEAFYTATDPEHAPAIMTFYIPFFMIIHNCWGDTYSVDSYLKRREKGIVVSPSESHWQYFLTARSILVILSVLFLSSAIFKIFFGGQWLVYPKLISNLVLHQNIKSAILGTPLNYLAPFISQTPIIYHSLRLTTLLFEGFFFLSLFSRTLRGFFVSLALIFHSFNALWLTVTFTPIMIVYGLFVDWQALKKIIYPHRVKFWDNLPSKFMVLGVIFLATLTGILWNSNIGIRTLFNLNGLIDLRTIWYPVLPFSLCWFAVVVTKMFNQKWGRFDPKY